MSEPHSPDLNTAASSQDALKLPAPTLLSPSELLPPDVRILDEEKERRYKQAYEMLDAKLRGAEVEKSGSKKSLILLGTLAAFVLWLFLSGSSAGTGWIANGALVIGVLLLHELGHLLAMKFFGYRDVTMFFIPFFGAAVSGRKRDVQPWQQAVVLLAGPLPGMFLGTALFCYAAHAGDSLLLDASTMLLWVNALNLLPIKPLDGGSFFEILIFCRWRWLSVVFGAFSIVAFAWFLIKIVGLSPLFVIILTSFQVSTLWRRWRMRCQLKEKDVLVPTQPDGGVLEDQGYAIFKVIEEFLAIGRMQATQLATIAHSHLEERQQTPPSIFATVVLFALFTATIVLTVVGVIAAAALNPGLFESLGAN